jgi:hypothetical protein
MTSLLGRLSPTIRGTDRDLSDLRLPTPARVRRPVMAAISILMVIASVVAFVSIYTGENHRIAALTVVRTVYQGQSITASDLGVADASVSGGVSLVPSSSSNSVIGKRAAVELVPGSLLSSTDVSASRQIPAGDAVVGIALKDGQLPSSGIEPGDHVMVVHTESAGAPAPPTPLVNSASPAASPGLSNGTNSGSGSPATQAVSDGVLVSDSLVYDVEFPPASSSGGLAELVSIEVSSTLASAVSIAATAGQVSLVLLPPTSPTS